VPLLGAYIQEGTTGGSLWARVHIDQHSCRGKGNITIRTCAATGPLINDTALTGTKSSSGIYLLISPTKKPHSIGFSGKPKGLEWSEQLTPQFSVATRPLDDVSSPDKVSNNLNNINGL
jgi:hypothetical protein